VTDSDDLWRLTLQHSPIGMALASPQGRVLMANQALADMLGHPVPALLELDFRALTHPDDLDVDVELYRRTLAGEIESYRLTKRYLHADGHVVWGDLSVALVRDRRGEPLHFISQVLDVTERRESDARFREATEAAVRDRQTLEAIFETVGVGLLLIGPTGRYERMNRRQVKAMELPFPEGHPGSAAHPGEAYLPDGRTPMPAEQRASYRAMQGEEFDDVTFWVGRDPRERVAYAVSARQVRGPDGESRGAVLAYQDVTQLLRAVQAQDEFVSSVSHELRTPLASVLGYLELAVEHEALPSEVGPHLEIVQRNARRLQALLTDLLDVAQAREGALWLERRPVDLVGLTQEAVLATLPAADDAGITVELTVEVASVDDVVVEVDERRVRQVVDNLLSNAVKYTPGPGEVHVVVRRQGTAAEIAVADTGIGIPDDELEHVFDRFFRGASALDQHTPGTGIGLNIVRSIVEAHDGTISVASEPGRGSTFVVSLPTTADAADRPDPPG
jgi:two-component system, OmpR family, phosphate regulon sensor histidine kinase PhoR